MIINDFKQNRETTNSRFPTSRNSARSSHKNPNNFVQSPAKTKKINILTKLRDSLKLNNKVVQKKITKKLPSNRYGVRLKRDQKSALFVLAVFVFGLLVVSLNPTSTRAAATLVQETTNFANTGTSVAITFSEAPTQNNLLVATLFTRGSTAPSAGTLPSGWSTAVEVEDTTSADWLGIYYKVAGASEATTHTFSGLESDNHAIWGAEYSGLVTSSVLDQTASTGITNATTISSGTTATTTQANELAIAAYSTRSNVSSSSYSNGFAEEGNVASTSGTPAEVFSATKSLSATGTVESTLTKSGSSGSLGTVATFKMASYDGSDWYNSSWLYRKKITVQSSEVDEDVGNYPVYVDLNDLGSDFHNNVRSDGGDIRITKADGTTELARELVDIDTGTPDSGELHFKADALSSTSNTEFYIYYGNPSATDHAIDATYGAENTWNSNYAAVYHMQEDPSISTDGPCGGGTKEVCDSTANDNDLDSNGTMTAGDSVAATIGQGIDFDGSNDYLSAADSDSLDITGDITWTHWVDPVRSNANEYIFNKSVYGTNNTGYGSTLWTAQYSVLINGNVWDKYYSTVSTANQLLQFTKNGTNAEAYRNGVSLTSWTDAPASILANTLEFRIGANNTGAFPFQGVLDEIRLMNKGISDNYASTEYNNLFSPSTFYSIGVQETDASIPLLTQQGYTFENDDGTTGSSGADWYNEDWTYRKQVTVLNTQVDANLTDFPVYVDLNNLGSDFHNNVRSDGGDIRITTSNGTTEVPREVVDIDTGTPDSGELHFKAPSLSSSVDTIFYIYYGNSLATDYAVTATYGAQNVWTNGYVSVWHLNEDCANSSSGCVVDSVGNNNLTSIGFGTGENDVAGKLGRADDFDGTDAYHDFVSADASADVGTTYSVSAWVNLDTLPTASTIFSSEYNTELSFRLDADGDLWGLTYAANTGDWPLYDVRTGDVGSRLSTSAGWEYVGLTVNGTDADLYYQGTEVGSYSENPTGTSVIDGTTQRGGIGIYRDNTTPYNHFDGQMDEIRFSSVTRTATWMSTEYKNQNSPSTFYSVSSQQTDTGIVAAVAATVQAGSAFSTGKTLESVRAGERINLRIQLNNNGGPINADDELALFYDRNDGIWSKVSTGTSSNTVAGDCTDTNWDCLTADNTGTNKGQWTSSAVDSTGRPWVSYYDVTSTALVVAQYVGAGGTGCTSSAWNCTTVDNTGTNKGSYTSIAIDAADKPWVSYHDVTGTQLVVAHFVGTGGSGCTSTAWTCENVDNTGTSTGQWTSIAFDSNNKPWVSYYDVTNTDLKVAHRNTAGFGSTCTDTDWRCGNVDADGTSIGTYTSIAFDNEGMAWISYYDASATALLVAKQVASGGTGCGGSPSEWTCETVDNTGTSTGQYTSIAFAPNGSPWVSYYDTTNADLRVAHRNTTGFGSTCTDTNWSCGAVDSIGTVGLWTDIAFSPSGNAWISYYDDDSTATNKALKYAYHVGSGGSGCADIAWSGCLKVDSNGADAVGEYSSISFGPDGKAWIAYYDGGSETSMKVANIARSGEILIAPSLQRANGESLTDSHADMTSVSDTTGRDDADCISGSTAWNNGMYSNSENLRGLTIADGETSAQCTEVAWTIDTSQAIAGETYRFVVALKNTVIPSGSYWRGTVGVATNGYPTLTMADADSNIYRYSKDSLRIGSNNCTSTDWFCEILTNDGNVGTSDKGLAFAPDGTAWTAWYEDETDGSCNNSNVDECSLQVAEYVGSGGDCTNTAWDCTIIDSIAADVGNNPTVAFDSAGRPWISYNDVTNGNVKVARYVGSAGTGCTSSSWTCMVVDDATFGNNNSIAFDGGGSAWISYRENTNSALAVAKYVGGGNGSGCSGSSNAWVCTVVDDIDIDTGKESEIQFDKNGIPWVAYYNDTDDDMMVAHYVGSGGNCDASGNGSDAWECETVHNPAQPTGNWPSIAIDSNGTPWVSYYEAGTTTALIVARRDGGGTGSCTDTDWNCETVDNAATVGSYSSIAIDADGNPWVSYLDTTNSTEYNLKVATRGGVWGSACTDADWTCGNVSTAVGDYGVHFTRIAFDSASRPWVIYREWTGTVANLTIATLKSSTTSPSMRVSNNYNGVNATRGDLAYYLASGLSPYANPYGTCGGLANLMGYCGIYTNDGRKDSHEASAKHRPMYMFSTRYSSNTELPTAKAHFTSSTSPATQNVKLQIYRYGSTNNWEDVATYSAAGCTGSDNCVMSGHPSGTASDYYELASGEYWVHYRLYQNESISADTTLYVDSFTAHQPTQPLRGGRVWRENVTDPLRW